MGPRLRAGRNRWLVACAVVVIAGGAIVGAVLSRPSGDDADAAVTPSKVAPITAGGVAPSDAPHVNASLAPGEAILTSTVDALDVYDAPDGTVVQKLPRFTYYASDLTLMAIAKNGADGATWYQVSLPAKPNGQTGWVRGADVTVSSTNTVVHVYLAQHELELLVGDDVAMTAAVAVGDPSTPTPLGTFSITDPLDFTANTTGVYGAYALGLSGYSEALDTFDGGPPQIAIHGTNQPKLIGESISNGCIRMTNDSVLDLASRVGLGTPVIISASRLDH